MTRVRHLHRGFHGASRRESLCDHQASTEWRAVEMGVPDLQLQDMFLLCDNIRFQCLHLGSDSSTSNIRSKLKVMFKIDGFNRSAERFGIILYFDGICFKHVLQGNVIFTFKMRLLMPKLYSTAFIARFAPRLSALIKAFCRRVRRD